MDISKQSPAFIRNLCRTCMSTSANIDVARNTTIFKQYLHEKPTAGKVTPLTLHQLLQSIRPDIYTHKEDKLPQVMCLRCIDQLQAVHEYIKMCQNSEREFRKLLLEPDERTPPRVEETITDSSPTVANEEYQTITVKDENMDVYESYEINIGNHQDQETTQSTSNTDMLPHTSSADMIGFHSSYGRSDESQDDDEWTPLAKRNRKCTDNNKSLRGDSPLVKTNQQKSNILDDHPARTNEDGKIPCQQCGDAFDSVSLWNEHILQCGTDTSANASKSRSSLAHSYKYPPDQIVSAISTGNENFTTKEELQEFLENNFQLIMRSFRAKRKLSNIERVKISKGIIQYLLTNPERLLNTKELEHISTLISEVFVGELPSTYYRRYTQGRHASGKLHDAYNNYRTFLAKSGIIQRRTKSRFAASSESEADIDQVSQDANITELTKFMEGAGQLMDNEVVNPQDILESWRHTFSRRRQELIAAKTPELYLKKYPVLLQPKGHQLYLLDAEMLIRKPLSFEVPSAFVSSISGLVKTKHDSVVAILKLIEDEECRIKRTVIAFMLLPYMFPPPIVTSENALVKMTKAECMESFINHYPDIETAEAAVTKLLAKQTEMKPFMVFIGSPIKISWLVMGSTKYSFEDLNSCIKHAMAAYLALNITYPFASQKPWFLLQKYIFKVSLPSDHMLDNKVKTVANDLNLIAR